jgi:hypothetical protein
MINILMVGLIMFRVISETERCEKLTFIGPQLDLPYPFNTHETGVI